MATVFKRTWTYKEEQKSAWVVRYEDGSGKQKQKTFSKKKDADRYCAAIDIGIDGGGLAALEGFTVKEVCEKFLRHSEGRLKEGKIGKGRYNILRIAVDKYIIPAIGKRKFTELTWADLDDWKGFLSKKGGLAPRTRETYVTVLKLIEDYAIKRGYAKKPVVREFRADAGSAKAAPIRTFTAEQAAQLLAAADVRATGRKKRPFFIRRCAVNLAAFCGLRFGEIMGLTRGCLDFDRRVIRIRHSLTAWGELKGPKTAAGRRDVPMPAHIAEMLKDWLEHFFLPNERDLVFRTDGGGDMACTNFHKFCWKPLLHRAGLWNEDGDQFHFHALRHFAASWMIEHGLSLPDVAALLGHSKFDMTLQVYAHPIVGGHRRHEAFDRMSGVLLTAARCTPAVATVAEVTKS